ncbi:MAG: DNA-directed RNA polymerase subunit K [Candidatus Micrarchaeota archaeon]|nr:DNA-directed RNA polymerase subunit K [Candidatus Micrarchaeota archaeon]
MAKHEEFVFTKYEEARIVGARALQLAMGAPPLIDIDTVKATLATQYVSPVDLAKAEFHKHLIPMHVVRKTA